MSKPKTIQVKQKSGTVRLELTDYFCENKIYIRGEKKEGVCGKLLLKAYLSGDSCVETMCPRCRSLQLIKKNV